MQRIASLGMSILYGEGSETMSVLGVSNPKGGFVQSRFLIETGINAFIQGRSIKSIFIE